MNRLRNVKRRAKERSEGVVWALGSSVWVPWALESRLPLLSDSDMHMEFDPGALVASGGGYHSRTSESTASERVS